MKQALKNSQLWPHKTYGDPGNPLLIALHGFMGSGEDWADLLSKLSEDFYCIAPTLPGHGHSPIEASIKFEDLAAGVIRLADAYQKDVFSLIGYSMGGRVALSTAVQYPQRIDKLILESCNPGIQDPEERGIRVKLDDQRAAEISDLGLAEFLHKWYQSPLFASLAARPDLLEATVQRQMKNEPDQIATALHAFSPGRQLPLWDALPELKMPVLMIAGELDMKYTGIMKEMAEKTPRARLEILPNCGHNTHLENAERFLESAIEFLKSKNG